MPVRSFLGRFVTGNALLGKAFPCLSCSSKLQERAQTDDIAYVRKRPDTLLKIASLFSYAVESPGS